MALLGPQDPSNPFNPGPAQPTGGTPPQPTGGTTLQPAGGTGIHDNFHFNHAVSDTTLERDFQRHLKIDGTATNFNINDYGTQFGHTERVNGISVANRRGELKVTVGTELGTALRESESIAREIKNAEDRLARMPDDKSAKKTLASAKKRAEATGKASQRTIAGYEKEIEAHRNAYIKQHGENLNQLFTKRQNLEGAIGSIGLNYNSTTGANTIDYGSLSELGNHTITVKVKDKIYTVRSDGIKDAGGKLIDHTIEHDTFHAIKDAAHEQVGRGFEKLEMAHSAALDEANAHYTAKFDHLKEMREKVTEHTGVGEWNGKTASKTTVGGANAAEKGIIGEADYKKLGTMEKISADVGANWKGSTGGKFKVGIGAIAIVDGLRRAYEGVMGMMSNDPQKQEQAGFGTLVIGGAEAAAGLATMRWGGKAKATGMAV